MGPNLALVKVLQEISLYYFKAKEIHRGINLKKAAESLKNHKVAISRELASHRLRSPTRYLVLKLGLARGSGSPAPRAHFEAFERGAEVFVGLRPR
jgi:hypothetical protein